MVDILREVSRGMEGEIAAETKKYETRAREEKSDHTLNDTPCIHQQEYLF